MVEGVNVDTCDRNAEKTGGWKRGKDVKERGKETTYEREEKREGEGEGCKRERERHTHKAKRKRGWGRGFCQKCLVVLVCVLCLLHLSCFLE